jgi:hypothetical protein
MQMHGVVIHAKIDQPDADAISKAPQSKARLPASKGGSSAPLCCRTPRERDRETKCGARLPFGRWFAR